MFQSYLWNDTWSETFRSFIIIIIIIIIYRITITIISKQFEKDF